MKKKLGIVSGMGSQAGAWLFQRIIDHTYAMCDQDYPEIFIHNNSQIPDRTTAIVFNGESPVKELKRSVNILENSGADLIVMACMTAYHFYDEIAKNSDVEIVNPVSVVIDELLNNVIYRQKKYIGLIGSSGLIKSNLYQKKLAMFGYKVIVLDSDEQDEYFMKPIYQSAKLGVVNDEIKQKFSYQLELLRLKGAEVILGACSEVPILINEDQGTAEFISVFELLAKNLAEQCYPHSYAI